MHTANRRLFEVLKTSEFQSWLEGQPSKVRAIILARLDMIAVAHLGDHKRFEGLLEFRWKNGLRVYGSFWGNGKIVLLYGGGKNGQFKDIAKAQRIRDQVLAGARPLLQP